jgi:hypothetical protein
MTHAAMGRAEATDVRGCWVLANFPRPRGAFQLVFDGLAGRG